MKRDDQTVDSEGRRLPSTMPGVEVVRLITHADHRGQLTPVIDTRDPFWAEPIVYAYRFTILPGRIKGWGMHKLQTDRYFVLSGNVRVVLWDGSCFEQFYFTDGTPGLVKIPVGIWHADQNWGQSEAQVVNFPTEPYNPTEPDKYRIDPASPEIPFDWTLSDG